MQKQFDRKEWASKRLRVKGRFIHKEFAVLIERGANRQGITPQEFINKHKELIARINSGSTTIPYHMNCNSCIEKMQAYIERGFTIKKR